ncbi:MAG: hypothetical protein ACE5KM_09515 [Planctomycetaceae bacterium]
MNDPDFPLQPIPESSPLDSRTPTPAVPSTGRGPEFRNPQASWNTLTPEVGLPRRRTPPTATRADQIEDWPHATLPGRARRGQVSATPPPRHGNDPQPAVRFRPARFSPSVPYIPPQPPSVQPQRLESPGRIAGPPNAYRSYRDSRPISRAKEIPVRNFE